MDGEFCHPGPASGHKGVPLSEDPPLSPNALHHAPPRWCGSGPWGVDSAGRSSVPLEALTSPQAGLTSASPSLTPRLLGVALGRASVVTLPVLWLQACISGGACCLWGLGHGGPVGRSAVSPRGNWGDSGWSPRWTGLVCTLVALVTAKASWAGAVLEAPSPMHCGVTATRAGGRVSGWEETRWPHSKSQSWKDWGSAEEAGGLLGMGGPAGCPWGGSGQLSLLWVSHSGDQCQGSVCQGL